MADDSDPSIQLRDAARAVLLTVGVVLLVPDGTATTAPPLVDAINDAIAPPVDQATGHIVVRATMGHLVASRRDATCGQD